MQPINNIQVQLTDRVVGSKYRCGQLLGSGSWGDVFAGENTELGKPVAIKILHAELAADENKRKRFMLEARAAGALQHTGICQVFDVGTTSDGIPFFVMELLEGVSLSAALSDKKRLPYKEAIKIAAAVCDALAVAHGQGVIHRDLTPANVMLVPDRGPVIVDFGLAKLQQDGVSTGGETLSRTGAVVGTPAYMSPEQCLGEPLDARTDIYSLACIVYEMISGRTPFTGEAKMAVMHAHATERPAPFAGNLLVPTALEKLLMRALSKDRNERPKDAAEFASTMRTAGQQQDTSVVLFIRQLPRPSSMAALTLALLAAAGTAAGGWFAYQALSHQQPPKKVVAVTAKTAEAKAQDLFIQANNAYKRGRFQPAVDAVDKLVALCDDRSIPADQAAEMLATCHAIYSNLGIYFAAEQTALKSIERFKEFCKPTAPQLVHEQLQLAQTYMAGSVKTTDGNSLSHDWSFSPPLYKCEQLLDQMIKTLETNGATELELAPVRAKQAQCWIIEGRYREAADTLAKALPSLRQVGDAHQCADLYCSFGNSLGKLGRTDEAVKAYQESTRQTKLGGDLNGTEIPSTIADLACMFQVLGNNKEARKYFEMSKELFARIPHSDFRHQRLLAAIADFNLFHGDPTQAYRNHHAAMWRQITSGRSSNIYRSTFDEHGTFDEEMRLRTRPHTLVVDPRAKFVNAIKSVKLTELDGIELTGNQIRNEDVAKLGVLPNLKYLLVGDTAITDGIADVLRQFPNLEELDVSATPVAMKTAKAIVALKHMKRLDAHMTQMRDAEMAVLARSQTLYRLGLSESGVSDAGLENLAKSHSIRQLDLRYAKVTDNGIAALGAMPHLERIELLNNPMTGSGLGKLTHLRALFFSAPITPSVDLSGLANMPSLELLRIPRTYADEKQLSFLPRLTHLKELNVACSRFDDDSVALLKPLNNLVALNLNHTRITDAALVSLGECSQLVDLRIAQNNLHDLNALRALKNLKFLNVADNPLDDKAADVLVAMPWIAGLNLDHTNMSPRALLRIGANKNVTQLSVNDYRSLSLEDICTLSTDTRMIRYYDKYLSDKDRAELYRRNSPGSKIIQTRMY